MAPGMHVSTPSAVRSLLLCAMLGAMGACQPDAPVVGRPATEAEKDAMPGFLVTVDQREITILSPLEPTLPGCLVELDQRWRMVIPPLGESDISARLPLSAFLDDASRPPRGGVTRIEITCPGASGPVQYTGRNGGGPAVTPWIYPDGGAS